MQEIQFQHRGSVAWYIAARLYTDAKGVSFDAGYFLEIKGIGGAQFDQHAAKPEASAHFTFSADTFIDVVVQNGDVSMPISAPGNWRLYYNEPPCGDFDQPESFSQGHQIATWRRDGLTAGMGTHDGALTILTFDLIDSVPFVFREREYDLSNLFPNSVTQFCFSGAGSASTLPNYPKVTSFAGTATVNV